MKKIFLLIIAIYAVAFFAKAVVNKGTVYGDGRYYYSYLHSIAIDHDLNFTNDFSHFKITEPITKFGSPRNVYSIGPALFWAPSFLLIRPVLGGDGYSFLYQLSIGLFDIGAVLVGLLLLYQILLNYFDEKISVLTIVGMAFATNLFFYGALDTVNSHGLSFLISTVVLNLFLKKRSPLLIGLSVGVLSLIRSQDAIFLLLLLSIVIPAKAGIHKKIMQLLAGIAGFVVGFTPQLTMWQLQYGTFLKSPYLDSDHYFNFLQPKLWEVLISPNNGLFFWTPLVALCILGIFMTSFPKQLPKRIFILLLIIAWYLIASWSFWWQGASYSGRMFISLFPILSLGLATILKKISSKYRVPLIVLFSIANMVAIFYFLLKT